MTNPENSYEKPTGPWDLPLSCFGHCDKEGWYGECYSKLRDKEAAESRVRISRRFMGLTATIDPEVHDG